MKKFLVTSVGLLLAISVAGPNCWAQTVYQFDGDTNDDFLVAANWNDIAAGPDMVPGPLDQGVINDSFVVKYDTAVATNVASLVVGADWPVTGPALGTPGVLNVSTGSIEVNGPGDAFTISRACCGSEGSEVNLSGDALLTIDGSDPVVGARDQGALNVRDTASVVSPNGYWRLGNYGPLNDPFNPPGGLQGDGLLNVEDSGSFSAMVIFVADQSSTGELRVSDNGSVVLANNLVPRPTAAVSVGSAKIQMNGSSATLSVGNNIESANGGEVPTLWEFNADSSGVSPILVNDAINIAGNDLVVNLNGYPLALFDTLLLFDGDQALAGDRIFGTFASSIVNGSVIHSRVIYDQVNGDIYVQRIPEPSTMLLLGIGMVMAVCMKRRAWR